jgi:hypothetical protein
MSENKSIKNEWFGCCEPAPAWAYGREKAGADEAQPGDVEHCPACGGCLRWTAGGLSQQAGQLPRLGRVLDYGCGRATLAKALPGVEVWSYDPAIVALVAALTSGIGGVAPVSPTGQRIEEALGGYIGYDEGRW